MSQNILIIAAHSDDEVLGCGGTIARHISEGDHVSLLFLTDGVSSREIQSNAQQEIASRENASVQALKHLGLHEDQIYRFNFPDNAMDKIPLIEIVQKIQPTIDRIEPEVIYTHHPGDLNIDHRCAFEATMIASRPQLGSSVKEIYTFEVASSTGWRGKSTEQTFTPNLHKDITPYWNHKLAALEAYAEEMRASPHARSIEAVNALAIYRGSQVGLARAEAFCIERIIN